MGESLQVPVWGTRTAGGEESEHLNMPREGLWGSIAPLLRRKQFFWSLISEQMELGSSSWMLEHAGHLRYRMWPSAGRHPYSMEATYSAISIPHTKVKAGEFDRLFCEKVLNLEWMKLYEFIIGFLVHMRTWILLRRGCVDLWEFSGMCVITTCPGPPSPAPGRGRQHRDCHGNEAGFPHCWWDFHVANVCWFSVSIC